MTVLIVNAGTNEDRMRSYMHQGARVYAIFRAMVRCSEDMGFQHSSEQFVDGSPTPIFRIARDEMYCCMLIIQ